MLSQIFKNVYMRLDEKAVTMAQPQKMWSGIHACSFSFNGLTGRIFHADQCLCQYQTRPQNKRPNKKSH